MITRHVYNEKLIKIQSHEKPILKTISISDVLIGTKPANLH